MTTNLNNLKVTELKEMAKELKIKNWWTLKKADLIQAIEEKQPQLLLEDYLAEAQRHSFRTYEDEAFLERLTQEEVNILLADNIHPDHLREALYTGLIEEGDPRLQNPIFSQYYNRYREIQPTEGVEVEEADEDILTLKEIILELGIKGTKARRILRNSDIERPYKRWEWDKNKHEEIIKQVIELLSK